MSIISFASSKGGVGKSTLNSMLANYIAYTTNYSVALLDCDENKSLTAIREKDLKEGFKNDRMYEFATISSNDVINHIDVISSNYDFVIIDLPGTIHQAGVLSSFSIVEHFFIPVALTEIEITPTNDFYTFLNEKVLKFRKDVGLEEPTIYGVLNKVDVRVNETKKFFDGDYKKFNFKFLENFVSESTDLKRSITTAKLYDKARKKQQYDDLCNEILTLIKN